MKRRDFLGVLGGAEAARPLAARAQQPAGRVYRIGYLWIASREQTLHYIKAFEEGLSSLGYRVGENVVIEYRFANGEMERLPTLATDLVRLGVNIIVTGFNPITEATMKATTTIPIVMATAIDPIRAGLVASLARPGGNVTGTVTDAVAEAPQALFKRFNKAERSLAERDREEPHPINPPCRLLRSGRERPRRYRPTEKRDELAPSHLTRLRRCPTHCSNYSNLER